jgi:hypothetical protein
MILLGYKYTANMNRERGVHLRKGVFGCFLGAWGGFSSEI